MNFQIDSTMVKFSATIKQFSEKGEKTGWTYIEIPEDIALQLKPGNKMSFRVKGKLDSFSIAGTALLPMGGGKFILPFNAAMRKGTKKKKGAMITVQLSPDKQELTPPPAFMECLADEPEAEMFFNSLSLAHRNYFIKWIGGVASEQAMARRIAQSVTALSRKMDYVAMVRNLKAEKEGFNY